MNPKSPPNPFCIWHRFLRTPISRSPTELSQGWLWILLGILKLVVSKEYFLAQTTRSFPSRLLTLPFRTLCSSGSKRKKFLTSPKGMFPGHKLFVPCLTSKMSRRWVNYNHKVIELKPNTRLKSKQFGVILYSKWLLSSSYWNVPAIPVGDEVGWHSLSFAGFPVNSNSNGENELCPKVRIGQDDLPGE